MNTRPKLAASITLLLATVVACGSPPTAAPLALTATPMAEPATATVRPFGGTVQKGQITSVALAGNLLGDPSTRNFYVYLPQGYDTTTQRYPVVYVLHWYTGDETQALRSVSSNMDWLIDKGEVGDMIFVFPDASNKLGGSLYMSSPTIGDYETYIAKELVAKVDSTYRTLPSRASRGIMGCSMGGHGSLHLALKYPDIFAVAAPMSGLLYDLEHDPIWDFARSHYGFEPADFGDLASVDMTNMYMIALASVAAPNPSRAPFYLDMPFRVVNGRAEIDPDVFTKVNSLDIMNDVKAYTAQPIRLNGLLLFRDTDQGADAADQKYGAELYERFRRELTELGIEHEFGQVESQHCMYDVSPILKFMDAHLEF